MGGGGKNTISNSVWKKCPCSPNHNTALIKQISLFDTALDLEVSIQNKKKIYFPTNKEVKTETW